MAKPKIQIVKKKEPAEELNAEPVVDKTKKYKQAVVMVHGMGEQVPMATLREFVKSVWVKNKDDGFNGQNSVWIKPDSRAGLTELKRITTDYDSKHKRTDFYEFYWADLMQGTTWQHVASWISGLLFRAPVTVPTNVFIIWVCLWIAVLGVATWGIITTFSIELTFVIETLKNYLPIQMVNCIETVLGWLNPDVIKRSFLVLICAIAFINYFPFKTLLRWRTLWTIPIFTFAAAVLFAVLTITDETIISPEVFSATLIAGAGFLVHQFLVPYFGDVARYVRATPENVSKRAAIRARGLELLKELHACKDYDRIILVSHSLGTIVAYDLLNILWSQIGPSSKNPMPDEALAHMKQANDFLLEFEESNQELNKSMWASFKRWFVRKFPSDKKKAENEAKREKYKEQLNTYRNMQRDISRSLAQPVNTSCDHMPWLISDFVTLGSPLTHAEFLMAENEEVLKSFVAERSLPSCPPVLEVRDEPTESGFLYGVDSNLPHHGAVFSAVRWTNIYDKRPPIAFWCGDTISGPVSENFGGIWKVDQQNRAKKVNSFSGVKDIEVKIPNTIMLLIPRFFTHTKYWFWNNKWNGMRSVGDLKHSAQHIIKLRDAVDLFDDAKKNY